MVGWRTAGAGRMEDGKERDLNQSSSKMDGARRGRGGRARAFNRGGAMEEGCRKKGGTVVFSGGVKEIWVEVQI